MSAVDTWDDLPEDVRRHYPWRGEFLTLPNGHKLHYLDEGQGPPLLMVHGNPTWSFYWRRLVAGLSDRYRCVVPDHLGAGLSDKPADWTYRLQDHIDNLVALIDHLDLRDVTLVVHDWGGPIGFGAAVARPERIARLVVFNTSVFLEHVPLSIRMGRWPVAGELLVQGLNGFLRVAKFRAIGDRDKLGDGVWRGYAAPYRRWSDRIGHLKFIRDIPVEAGHPTRAVIERLTEEVPAKLGDRPALLVWGERDFVFTPKFLERWQALLPHAEVERYPDISHWVVEEAHERILPRVTRFLEEHPLPEKG
ncbi:MAG: alpha/beta fold hydrolase [Myxococcota bacterium]